MNPYSNQKSDQQRYPREQLVENEKNLNLGGSYQNYIYNCGECCGNCSAICPCNPFVEYPYKKIEQGYVGVYLRFGKYVKTMPPGLQYFNPCTDKLIKIDCRTQMIDCEKQQVITKDNILLQVDASVYYRVLEPKKAIFYIYDMQMAVSQITLASIKCVIGAYTLQDVLEKRTEIQDYIQQFVDDHVDDWGIDIELMMIKDIQIDDRIKSALAQAATELRAAQAKILIAESNVQSAKLMKEAAELLSSKAAMQIRYLEVINKIGCEQQTKVMII
ncbi:unnamed protein product (macronuclear) [Paramecium tetraurelia]|uniref:Band 7 domain-containing protein n=1 Tax=Paramecium tetraurelia TaxID=5888 RepID=A0CSQ8_PARTE|nr:uncharacterized protein GSPATT00010097001 [Paramecium tetraurelia]CAK73825.1 unnamed protein product [Paramecium tetraurelia]|eukprot:XP_001441222.1 hypothetical protein (macronuclear) [Paramecium tetraurelia strain d4-2]